MYFENKLLDTKIFLIFIFILIVSANFLAEIFPCRLQYLLKNNMLVKHLFGFFTILFFVRLSNSDDKNLLNIIKHSFLLYLIFILISKSNIYFFYFILLCLGITYIINLQKEDDTEKFKNNEINQQEYDKKIKTYDIITYVIYILIFIATIIGIFIYMGEKKIEYKKKFNYLTFFIGSPKCINKSPDFNFIKALKAHFL
jgi:hypothetical protein